MDMIKPKEIGRALSTMWSDLTAEAACQYQELPPVLLPQLRNLHWRGADDSELSRATWFWLRRPKSTFCKGSTALVLEGLWLLLSVITAFVVSSEISISALAIEAIIVLFAVAIGIGAVVYRVRLVRWRREYERSVNRLIRTIYRGV
jgi:hypothetical protein